MLLETDFWQVGKEIELVGGHCRRDKLGSPTCLGEFWRNILENRRPEDTWTGLISKSGTVWTKEHFTLENII